MDFTVKSVNSLEKEFDSAVRHALNEAKVKNVIELNHNALMKLNKDQLANLVTTFSSMMKKGIELCKSAAGTIDELKTEQLVKQKELISLQKEQLGTVRETVKTEIKSTWSDIVKKNSSATADSVENVKKAIKSVVIENERSRNFIIYGAKDNDGELENNEELNEVVSDVFCLLNEHPKPQILSVNRLGKWDKNPSVTRPIKVTLASSEEVKRLLRSSHRLKSEGSGHLYLAPDRSREERLVYKNLVAEVKKLIQDQPNKYHYIRDYKVISVDKIKS
jgi:hypothetical protein